MLRLSAKFVVLVKKVSQKVLCFRPRYLGGSCVLNFAPVEQKMAAEQKKPLNVRPLMELREILRERRLPTSGNKNELAARLFEAEPKLEQCVPVRAR